MRFDKLELNDKKPKPPQPGAADAAPVNKDEKYWLKQADEHRRTGNYENSLRFYSRALEVDKALVPAWVGQVQMLVLLKEYPQAELWARKSLEIFPNNGDLLAGRAQALCRQGDMKNAYAISDAAFQQQGQTAYRWMVRGELAVAGRQDTDRPCFDRAQTVTSDWLVPLESALIYLFYRSPTKALQRAQEAAQRAPDSHYAWLTLGRCQQQLGFATSARNSYERCLELCPRHIEAGNHLAEVGTGSWTASLRRWFGRS